MSNTAALSNVVPDFQFLRDESAARSTSMLLTPLEEDSPSVISFANYTTGTKGQLRVSPQMLAQCEELRKIKVTADLKRLAYIIAQLQNKLNTGSNSKATGIITPVLIASQVPFIDNVNDLTEDLIERSTKVIDCVEGIAMLDGLPLWERIEGERVDFYNVFKLYRDSRYLIMDNGEYILQTRTMAGLARSLELPGELIAYLSKLYAWAARCAYYDEYMEEQMRRRRATEIQLLQADQYKAANKLVKESLSWLTNNMKAMKPKEALEMLELGMRYMRINLGLQGDKPGTSAVAGNQTTLSIYNTTTNNKADNMLNVNAPVGSNNQSAGSAVERQLQEDMKEDSNLLSILHVLQASGAMGTVVRQDLNEGKNLEDDIIDVEGDADE